MIDTGFPLLYALLYRSEKNMGIGVAAAREGGIKVTYMTDNHEDMMDLS